MAEQTGRGAMRLVALGLGGARGGMDIFSGVDFSLSPGEALIVTGPNGAGKSTLLRIIAGLLPAAAGTVRLEGACDADAGTGAACHYLGHLNGMKTVLTTAENLHFWQRFCGAPRLAPDVALARVGLAGLDDLPYGTLSTGQRRRAALARLLVAHRPVWLLDEPTAGLDHQAEGEFAALVAAHRWEGGIVVAATHAPLDLADAAFLPLGPSG